MARSNINILAFLSHQQAPPISRIRSGFMSWKVQPLLGSNRTSSFRIHVVLEDAKHIAYT